MIKKYNSFEEIDNRLKILTLQREIDKESLKLNLKHSKIDVAPSRIFEEVNVVLQKKLITWLIKSLRKLYTKN